MALSPEALVLCGGVAVGSVVFAMRKLAERKSSRREPSESAVAQADTGAVSVVWRREYATGNPTIDEQHQQLFRLASVLLNALAAGNSQAVILPSLERFFKDVRQHFATEEAILAKLGHPDLDAHRDLHAKLLQRCEMLVEGYRTGSIEQREVFSWIAYDMVAMHVSREDWALFGFKY